MSSVPSITSGSSSTNSTRAASKPSREKSSSSSRGWRGTVMMKVDPSPGVLSTSMEPPIMSTTFFVMAMPKPVPSIRFVASLSSRSKGSNRRSRNSGDMPRPVSCTTKR